MSIRTQFEAVRNNMREGGWWTIEQMRQQLASEGIGSTETSVSARIRDLRKPAYGGYTIKRRQLTPRSLWEYAMVTA